MPMTKKYGEQQLEKHMHAFPQLKYISYFLTTIYYTRLQVSPKILNRDSDNKTQPLDKAL